MGLLHSFRLINLGFCSLMKKNHRYCTVKKLLGVLKAGVCKMCLFGAVEFTRHGGYAGEIRTRQMFSLHSTREGNLKKQQSPASGKLECTVTFEG